MKNINLKLKKYGCYMIGKTGITFYTDRGFSVFVPKKIIKKLEGMI